MTPAYLLFFKTISCDISLDSINFLASIAIESEVIVFGFFDIISFAVIFEISSLVASILRKSPSVITPSTLSFSITAVTPSLFSEISIITSLIFELGLTDGN